MFKVQMLCCALTAKKIKMSKIHYSSWLEELFWSFRILWQYVLCPVSVVFFKTTDLYITDIQVMESKTRLISLVLAECLIRLTHHIAGQTTPPKTYINFHSRQWGSSLPVWHAWWVRSSPHRHKRKLYDTCVCRVTFKHLPQPLRSHIRSFGTQGQLLKLSPLSAQKCYTVGVWGQGLAILRFESRDRDWDFGNLEQLFLSWPPR